MPSPILRLAKSIAAAPYRVAPESANELHAIIQAKNITLSVSDSAGFNIEVVPHEGEISITESALELLWACAHASYVFYQEYVEANKAGQARYTVGETGRSRRAMDLLRWAILKARDEVTGVGAR